MLTVGAVVGAIIDANAVVITATKIQNRGFSCAYTSQIRTRLGVSLNVMVRLNNGDEWT